MNDSNIRIKIRDRNHISDIIDEELSIILSEIEVGYGDDELYEKAKVLQRLDKAIKRKIETLKQLQKRIDTQSCEKVSQSDLWAYCRGLINVSKGKAPNGKKK